MNNIYNKYCISYKLIASITNNQSELWKLEVTFLEHVVSFKGIHMDQNKVKAIEDWSTSKNASKFCLFLGLFRYYHYFI